jgi:hypothetical protein
MSTDRVLKDYHLFVIDNRVLREIFEPKRDEGSGEDYITRSFMICTPQQIAYYLRDQIN